MDCIALTIQLKTYQKELLLASNRNTMPFNPALDDKLQNIVKDWPNTKRIKMFGGTGYLLNGNMVVGVYRELLVLRIGKEQEEEMLTQTWCRPMDVTGKPMKGWLFVESEAWDSDEHLTELVEQARRYVSTMPPK